RKRPTAFLRRERCTMRFVLATTAALLTMLGLGTGSTKVWADEPSDLVQNWYVRYLGRPADPSGLNNWVGYLYRGVSPEFVQTGILDSDDYYYRQGSIPEGFVTGLYVDVLGRATSCLG